MKKIIVIGVITLFLFVGFQPAFANDNISIGIERQQPLDEAFKKKYETMTYDRSYYVQ